MTLEDREAGFLRLLERGGQHVGGDAVDLGVELERRDELRRAGDLEVHVAVGVLGSEDVGERGVLALGEDEAHGDAGDRGPQGHTGVHHRQGRAADRRHRGGAVGGEHVGHGADRRRGTRSSGRDDGQERPLGEEAVADLAALRARRMKPVSPVRERREVVVVHVALATSAAMMPSIIWSIRCMFERADVEDLRLAALEEARAVRAWQEPDLGGKGADVARGRGRRCGRRRSTMRCGRASSWSPSGTPP